MSDARLSRTPQGSWRGPWRSAGTPGPHDPVTRRLKHAAQRRQETAMTHDFKSRYSRRACSRPGPPPGRNAAACAHSGGRSKNMTLRYLRHRRVNQSTRWRPRRKRIWASRSRYIALNTDERDPAGHHPARSFDIADIEYFSLPKVCAVGQHEGHGCRQDRRITTRSSASSADGKLTPDSEIAQGTAPHDGSVRRGPRRHRIRRPPNRLDDADPDHLQRRHAGHPPRPDRPSH